MKLKNDCKWPKWPNKRKLKQRQLRVANKEPDVVASGEEELSKLG